MEIALKALRYTTLFLILLTLAGCGSYTLQGRVIRGDMSLATFVKPDDARLNAEPVSSVQITVYRDPDKLSSKLEGRAVSATDGSFEIDLSGFGTGWMEEQWLVEASRTRYRNAAWIGTLTGTHRERVLLIMLAPGDATPTREDDNLLKQYEQFRY